MKIPYSFSGTIEAIHMVNQEVLARQEIKDVLIRIDRALLDRLCATALLPYMRSLAVAEFIALFNETLMSSLSVKHVLPGAIELRVNNLVFFQHSKEDYIVYFTDGDVKQVREYPCDLEFYRANRFYAFHEVGNKQNHVWFSEKEGWLKE